MSVLIPVEMLITIDLQIGLDKKTARISYQFPPRPLGIYTSTIASRS